MVLAVLCRVQPVIRGVAVQEVDLSSNRIASASQVARLLPADSVSTLRLASNRIEHVSSLRRLAALRSLRVLDVSDNFLELALFDASALYAPFMVWLLPMLTELNGHEAVAALTQRAKEAFHADDGSVVRGGWPVVAGVCRAQFLTPVRGAQDLELLDVLEHPDPSTLVAYLARVCPATLPRDVRAARAAQLQPLRQRYADFAKSRPSSHTQTHPPPLRDTADVGMDEIAQALQREATGGDSRASPHHVGAGTQGYTARSPRHGGNVPLTHEQLGTNHREFDVVGSGTHTQGAGGGTGSRASPQPQFHVRRDDRFSSGAAPLGGDALGGGDQDESGSGARAGGVTSRHESHKRRKHKKKHRHARESTRERDLSGAGAGAGSGAGSGGSPSHRAHSRRRHRRRSRDRRSPSALPLPDHATNEDAGARHQRHRSDRSRRHAESPVASPQGSAGGREAAGRPSNKELWHAVRRVGHMHKCVAQCCAFNSKHGSAAAHLPTPRCVAGTSRSGSGVRAACATGTPRESRPCGAGMRHDAPSKPRWDGHCVRHDVLYRGPADGKPSVRAKPSDSDHCTPRHGRWCGGRSALRAACHLVCCSRIEPILSLCHVALHEMLCSHCGVPCIAGCWR